jgi:hypothetical protein
MMRKPRRKRNHHRGEKGGIKEKMALSKLKRSAVKHRNRN